MDTFSDIPALKTQYAVSSALFIPAVLTFFFLVGLGRKLSTGTKARWLIPIIWLSYLYSICLTMPYSSQFPVSLAGAIVGYWGGKRLAKWFDSGHVWTLLAMLVASILGGWAVRLAWYSDGPLGWSFGYMGPGVRMETRAGSFVIDRRSIWGQEFQGPFLETLYGFAGLLVLIVVCVPISLIFRKRLIVGLRVAVALYLLCLSRFIPESSSCMVACLILGYTVDGLLPREVGGPRRTTKIITALGLFLLATTATYLVTWKFIGLVSPPVWDVVCLAYGTEGLIVGRCLSFWGGSLTAPRQSHVSFDQALFRARSSHITSNAPWIRLDAVFAILPFVLLGFAAVLVAGVRGVRIPASLFLAISGGISVLSVALLIGQSIAWWKTRKRVPFSRDRARQMQAFSAISYRSARISFYEVAFLALVPIAMPAAVSMYVGLDTIRGVVTNLFAFFVGICTSRLAIFWKRSRPPAVLVLGTSTNAAVQVHSAVSRAIAPLRAVSLLALDRPDAEDTLPPRADCLRTIWHEDWFDVVRGLIGLSAMVVLDGRQSSDPTRQELQELFHRGDLRRTVLICEDDGRIPLVEEWNRHSSTPISGRDFLAIVSAAKVGEAVKHLKI
jgi:hypothetical protein